MHKEAIIIIDIFLNTSFKTEVFLKTLESVKKLNLPIMVISNYDVPDILIKQFDYFIFSKENILFTHKYDRYPSVCFFMDSQEIRYENINNCYQKHGLSVINNLNICTNYAINAGFKKFIRIEWDFIIDSTDIEKIQNLIKDFIHFDKKAYFIYNASNCSGLPNICYHFWMVDLKFWKNNFPEIYNENQYINYIQNINNQNFFEIAERILYLSLFDKLNQDEIIDENDFYKNFKNSVINAIINDINFELPSNDGICRGLAKIIKNNSETGQLAIMTWNRINNNTDLKKYELSFSNVKHYFHHEVKYNHWIYDVIPDFDATKYPIKLKIENFFEKEYFSSKEINSIIYFK